MEQDSTEVDVAVQPDDPASSIDSPSGISQVTGHPGPNEKPGPLVSNVREQREPQKVQQTHSGSPPSEQPSAEANQDRMIGAPELVSQTPSTTFSIQTAQTPQSPVFSPQTIAEHGAQSISPGHRTGKTEIERNMPPGKDVPTTEDHHQSHTSAPLGTLQQWSTTSSPYPQSGPHQNAFLPGANLSPSTVSVPGFEAWDRQSRLPSGSPAVPPQLPDVGSKDSKFDQQALPIGLPSSQGYLLHTLQRSAAGPVVPGSEPTLTNTLPTTQPTTIYHPPAAHELYPQKSVSPTSGGSPISQAQGDVIAQSGAGPPPLGVPQIISPLIAHPGLPQTFVQNPTQFRPNIKMLHQMHALRMQSAGVPPMQTGMLPLRPSPVISPDTQTGGATSTNLTPGSPTQIRPFPMISGQLTSQPQIRPHQIISGQLNTPRNTLSPTGASHSGNLPLLSSAEAGGAVQKISPLWSSPAPNFRSDTGQGAEVPHPFYPRQTRAELNLVQGGLLPANSSGFASGHAHVNDAQQVNHLASPVSLSAAQSVSRPTILRQFPLPGNTSTSEVRQIQPTATVQPQLEEHPRGETRHVLPNANITTQPSSSPSSTSSLPATHGTLPTVEDAHRRVTPTGPPKGQEAEAENEWESPPQDHRPTLSPTTSHPHQSHGSHSEPVPDIVPTPQGDPDMSEPPIIRQISDGPSSVKTPEDSPHVSREMNPFPSVGVSGELSGEIVDDPRGSADHPPLGKTDSSNPAETHQSPLSATQDQTLPMYQPSVSDDKSVVHQSEVHEQPLPAASGNTAQDSLPQGVTEVPHDKMDSHPGSERHPSEASHPAGTPGPNEDEMEYARTEDDNPGAELSSSLRPQSSFYEAMRREIAQERLQSEQAGQSQQGSTAAMEVDEQAPSGLPQPDVFQPRVPAASQPMEGSPYAGQPPQLSQQIFPSPTPHPSSFPPPSEHYQARMHIPPQFSVPSQPSEMSQAQARMERMRTLSQQRGQSGHQALLAPMAPVSASNPFPPQVQNPIGRINSSSHQPLAASAAASPNMMVSDGTAGPVSHPASQLASLANVVGLGLSHQELRAHNANRLASETPGARHGLSSADYPQNSAASGAGYAPLNAGEPEQLPQPALFPETHRPMSMSTPEGHPPTQTGNSMLDSAEQNKVSSASQPPYRDPYIVWEKSLDVYLERESLYATAVKTQILRQRALIEEKAKEVDYLRRKYSQELGQSHYPLELVVGRKRKLTEDLCFPEQRLLEVADQQEALVPIRLDLDVDGIKVRDTFTWNMHETLVQPVQFAEMMCEDLHLPAAIFIPAIEKAINEQISDFYQHAPSALTDAQNETRGSEGMETNDKDAPELRTVIKLDITVGNHCLVDQFEWDLNCKRNNPEVFADHMCNELALGLEFKTAIAHQIREQIQTFAKSLLLVDHQFDGTPIDDEDLAACFLPPVDRLHVHRSLKDKAMFGPYYNPVTDLEIEKMEKDRERDTRRKRRQTQRSRRAISLPDREFPKTNRTGPLTYNPLEVVDPLAPLPAGPITRRNATRKTRGMLVEPLVPAVAPVLVVPEKEILAASPPNEMALVRGWSCENCGVSAAATPWIRKNSAGEMVLCDDCGLHLSRFGTARPVARPRKASSGSSHGGERSVNRRDSEQQATGTDTSQPTGPTRLDTSTTNLPSPNSGQLASGASQTHSMQFKIPLPTWLPLCRDALMRLYPDDQFDVVPKGRTGELRLKCHDCPGKLYQTGPGQSLTNFEIHLKNRHHRANVNARLTQSQPPLDNYERRNSHSLQPTPHPPRSQSEQQRHPQQQQQQHPHLYSQQHPHQQPRPQQHHQQYPPHYNSTSDYVLQPRQYQTPSPFEAGLTMNDLQQQQQQQQRHASYQNRQRHEQDVHGHEDDDRDDQDYVASVRRGSTHSAMSGHSSQSGWDETNRTSWNR